MFIQERKLSKNLQFEWMFTLRVWENCVCLCIFVFRKCCFLSLGDSFGRWFVRSVVVCVCVNFARNAIHFCYFIFSVFFILPYFSMHCEKKNVTFPSFVFAYFFPFRCRVYMNVIYAHRTNKKKKIGLNFHKSRYNRWPEIFVGVSIGITVTLISYRNLR